MSHRTAAKLACHGVTNSRRAVQPIDVSRGLDWSAKVSNVPHWRDASLVAIVVALAAVSGCAGAPPSVDLVSYSASPVSAASPSNATRTITIKRPTRTSAVARQDSTPTAGLADVKPNDISVTAADSNQIDPSAALADQAVSVDAATPPAVVQSTARLSPASSRTPRGRRTPTPGIVPGEVDASVGLFVTSDSKSTRYFYARADSRWHRIRAIHQKWFASIANLLKAFPNRAPPAPRTPRPTAIRRTPTPTP